MMKISTKLLSLALSVSVAASASAIEPSAVTMKAPAQNARVAAPVLKTTGSQAAFEKNISFTTSTTKPVQLVKAPAKADDSFGEWETGITGNYTYTQLFESPTKIPVTLERRVSTTDPGHIQYKVTNFLNSIQGINPIEVIYDLVLDSETGLYNVVIPTVPTGINVRVSQTSSVTTQLYYDDNYTYLSALLKEGVEGLTQEIVDSWFGASTYNPVTGRFTLAARYHGAVGGEYQTATMGNEDEILQLDGDFKNYDVTLTDGYFYKKNGNGYYNVDVELNDVPLMFVGLRKGEFTQASELEEALIGLVSGEYGTPIEENGEAEIIVTPYEDGDYELLYVTMDEEGNVIDYDYTEVELSGAEFAYLGIGKYTDAFVGDFLKNYATDVFNQLQAGISVGNFQSWGVPNETYTSECTIEESDVTPGLYRVRWAYQNLYNDYILPVEMEKPDGLDIVYNKGLDELVVDASDPAKVVVDLGMPGLGFWHSAGAYVPIYVGSDILINEEPFEDSYCQLKEGKITCIGEYSALDDWGPLFTGYPNIFSQTGGLYTFLVQDCSKFLIELPDGDNSAIDNIVADDANAPVEYFNLQGVKVQNPENGLYIKRQGKTVEKVVIRK